MRRRGTCLWASNLGLWRAPTLRIAQSPPQGSRMRRIEELPIAPGRERAVHVSYTPQRLQAGADGAPATRLTRRVFRVDLKAFAISRQRADASPADAHLSRSVQCRARVCTSVVAISPSRLDMGDCNIQVKQMPQSLLMQPLPL